MVKTADRTKRERRLERAEAKAAARRRLERRKRLGWMLGAVAIACAIAIGVVAFLGGSSDPGAGPSDRTAVVAAGPARSEPLARGDSVPEFSAPGLHGERSRGKPSRTNRRCSRCGRPGAHTARWSFRSWTGSCVITQGSDSSRS